MRQCFFSTIFFLVIVGLVRTNAQEGVPIQLVSILESMPKPLPTLSETWEAYPDMYSKERKTKHVYNEIAEGLKAVYYPLFERFKQNIVNGKVNMGSFSPEERKLMEHYRQGSKGFSEENSFLYFLGLVENRPLLSSKKFSWTIPSGQDQKLFQELVAIEKAVNWNEYNLSVRKAYKFVGTSKEQDAIQTKFDADFKKLPQKKRKIFEGVYEDIADPDKAIVLYEQSKQQKLNLFNTQYSPLVRKWSMHYASLASLCKKLDQLSVHTHSPTGKLLIADLQGRALEALKYFALISDDLISESLIALISIKLDDEGIALYQAYKESFE